MGSMFGGGGGGGMGASGYAGIAGGIIGGAGSILSMIGSQKSKKFRTFVDTMPQFTEQGTAAQNVMLRLLFDRMAQGPQSFKEFKGGGPRPRLPQGAMTPTERQTLGLGPSNVPVGVNPMIVQALQQLGYTGTGGALGPRMPGGAAPLSAPQSGARR